jgi:hypothetical protein
VKRAIELVAKALGGAQVRHRTGSMDPVSTTAAGDHDVVEVSGVVVLDVSFEGVGAGRGVTGEIVAAADGETARDGREDAATR